MRDQSNLEWIEFSYGRQTGRTTASVRMEYERPGFELTAEMAGTWDFRQHPSTAGRKAWHTTRSRAWFVNFEKHLGGLVVGGELFRMDPLYSTMVSVEDAEYSSYSDDLNSPFGIAHSFPIDRNNTSTWTASTTTTTRTWLPTSTSFPTCRTAASFRGGTSTSTAGSTTTRTATASPTTWSPSSSTTPIPPSSSTETTSTTTTSSITARTTWRPTIPTTSTWKGYHLFVDLEPLRDLRMRLGRFRTDEIWGGGRNDVSYTRIDYERTLFPFGKVLLTNYLKNVRDDIEDDAPFLSVYSPNQLPLQPGTGVGSLLNRAGG